MRYLKYFKEGNKEDYYIEYDRHHIRDYYKQESINISKSSINYITKLFPNIKLLDSSRIKNKINRFLFISKYRYSIINTKEDDKEIEYLCISKRRGDWDRVFLTINELPDEYFRVKIDTDDYSYLYYICDQLDGVKELLTDLKII